ADGGSAGPAGREPAELDGAGPAHCAGGHLGSRSESPVEQSVPEPLAPARPDRLESELALRLRIRRAADPGHHLDSDLADGEPCEPDGNAARPWRAQHLREVWQPLRDRGGIVVDDVVDAAVALLDGESRRGGGVVCMDERPDPATVADERELAPVDQ